MKASWNLNYSNLVNVRKINHGQVICFKIQTWNKKYKLNERKSDRSRVSQ